MQRDANSVARLNQYNILLVKVVSLYASSVIHVERLKKNDFEVILVSLLFITRKEQQQEKKLGYVSVN